MGNCILQLADGIVLIASDHTWIEGKAIQQLETTARLPGMQYVAGMPDLHPGRGYPVGAAFFSRERFYPALVGNDIGCGMALWQTDLPVAKLRLDKLEQRLGNIDEPLAESDIKESWQDGIDRFGLPLTGHERSLGTIGGGNHFAELQQLDVVYDEQAVLALQLDRSQLLLLVHSGSRGLGEAILREQIEQFGHHGLAEDSAEAQLYLARHDGALRFAERNRELIARRMLERLRAHGSQRLDVHHNLVSRATIAGYHGWLHRKGATPSDAGPVVIPGSRGDYSYLVQPVVDDRSLRSLAHGAGRKWQRSDCKDRLRQRYTAEQLTRTPLGSRVICADRSLLFEEAPEAYKPIDSVVGALRDAGLVQILARLKPVLTYKTRGENG